MRVKIAPAWRPETRFSQKRTAPALSTAGAVRSARSLFARAVRLDQLGVLARPGRWRRGRNERSRARSCCEMMVIRMVKLFGLASDAVVIAIQMWRVGGVASWNIVSPVRAPGSNSCTAGRRLRPVRWPHPRPQRSHEKPSRRQSRLTSPAYACSPASLGGLHVQVPPADSEHESVDDLHP